MIDGFTRARRKEERLLREYQMCFERWLSMNSQVWQVPALAVTAEAFLFTIMFSSDTGQWPRIASAFLAIVASYLSIHVIWKHRYHQSHDYGRMVEIEHELDLTHLSYGAWADADDWEDRINALLPGGRRLQSRKLPGSSVTVWVVGLAIFGVVAAGVIVTAWLLPSLYGASPADPPPFVLVIGH